MKFFELAAKYESFLKENPSVGILVCIQINNQKSNFNGKHLYYWLIDSGVVPLAHSTGWIVPAFKDVKHYCAFSTGNSRGFKSGFWPTSAANGQGESVAPDVMKKILIEYGYKLKSISPFKVINCEPDSLRALRSNVRNFHKRQDVTKKDMNLRNKNVERPKK